jgi:nitronate monooxygenase
MALPRWLATRLRLPMIGAPMFPVSGPALVAAQCRAGIIGAFPSLNARPRERLADWLAELDEGMDAAAAPFAVNLIVHRRNDRLEHDLEVCVDARVPIVITSLGARPEVNDAVHGYGGLVLHDVTDDRFARKAIEKGADGLIAVAAGAGGHAGALSPFALVGEIRRWFDGPLALAGAIATGEGVLAAEAIGADLAHVGSPFIATPEARADPAYRAMIVAGTAADIVNTDHFSGIAANYLEASVRAAGFDRAALPATRGELDLRADGDGPRPWRDIWSAGQGIGVVDAVAPAGERIAAFAAAYDRARRRLCGSG